MTHQRKTNLPLPAFAVLLTVNLAIIPVSGAFGESGSERTSFGPPDVRFGDWTSAFDTADESQLADARRSRSASDPDPQELFTASLVFLRNGHHEDAEELLRDAVRIELSRARGLDPAGRELVNLLETTHEYGALPIIMERIIAANPEFVPAKVLLGFISYRQDRYDRVIELGEAVLEHTGVSIQNRVDTHLLLAAANSAYIEDARLLRKLSLVRTVRRHLERGRELNPDDSRVLLAWANYKLNAPRLVGGNKSEAPALIERAIEVNPRLVGAHALMAIVREAEGDMEGYRSHLDTAIALDPDHELVQEALLLGK